MGFPESRGMNNALSEGSTDGKYKKVVQNRDGVIDRATVENRLDLDDNWYGIHEKRVKVTPDGLLHATPLFEQTNPISSTDAV